MPGSESVVNGKQPMSAIATARIRAQVARQDIAALEPIHERLPPPSRLQVEIAGPGRKTSTLDVEEEESGCNTRPTRTFKLCDWRNDAEHVLSETDLELVINLPKHSTIALVGCFDFTVIKGAVNINGANIGPLNSDGKQNQMYRAFVPTTHPILKLRGLDATNHVKFMTCEVPVPLASINPFFNDIWLVHSNQSHRRSFSIVGQISALCRFLEVSKYHNVRCPWLIYRSGNRLWCIPTFSSVVSRRHSRELASSDGNLHC